jgi:hypothetical protein
MLDYKRQSNIDTVPFRTLGRIRASVVTKGRISHSCAFRPAKFHRRLVVKEATGSPRAVVPRAVETGCQGGHGSPRAVVPRAVETGCQGGHGSPRAVAPSEEED